MSVPRKSGTLNSGRLAATALVALTSAAVTHQAFSQIPAFSADPTPTAEWAVEQQSRERWLHGRQQSRFTPFHTTREWALVDSIRSDDAGRRVYLTLGRRGYGRDSALIVVAPNGRITRLNAAIAHFVRGTVTSPGDSLRYEETRRRIPDDGGVALPESRLWDLVPTPRSQSPRIGLAWTDSIARVASHGPFRQQMHGTRTSRIVGARIVAGHRLWLVRSASRREMGGLVLVPDSRLEDRLAADDVKARDSLLAVWQRTADPGSAAAIFRLLQMWPRSSDSRALIERVRVAAGDTAYLYTLLSQRVGELEPLDTADVRAMLPFMEDPGLAWSVNLSSDWPYENLAQALTTRPPAAGEADFPYRSLPCTPAACRLLAAQWHSAREPRLRDVGLVALLATDPAHWADTVLALDGPSRPLLHAAAQLALGVATTWGAASRAPMPPPSSDWHAWLEWMDGRDPRYVAMTRQSSLPPRVRQDTLPRVRFEESHVVAIRFFEARTGRDIVAELRRGYEHAPSDSARLVFGTMLEGLDALQAGDEQLVAWFRSGNPAQVALARRLLPSIVRKFARADTSVTVSLLERLLAAIVDSAPLWPDGVADPETNRSDPAILHMPRGAYFLDTVGIPPRIRAEWGSRVELINQSLWNEHDVREPSVYLRIEPIATWGHFARVQFTATQRYARKPDEAPRAYASGATYWLMSVDGQWVIVGESAWVT